MPESSAFGNCIFFFSVSFFPEGGHLLTGYRQQMAFKCQRSNGYSGMLEGYIVNQSGDTLTQVKSEHDGMGTFSFLPAKDNSYYALVRSPGCEVIVNYPKSHLHFSLLFAYKQFYYSDLPIPHK